MVTSLENTMTKWRAVNRALLRASGGKLRGTAELRKHNVPTYQQIHGHLTNAFSAAINRSMRPSVVRAYFMHHPNKRQSITAAYNKLNNLARELATVRAKALATSTIQRHWQRARPAVMNKRRATTLLTLQALPGVPETRRMVFDLAFPKPVYGPKTRMNAHTSRRKYSAY
jgi:hypothetical protein